MAYQIPQFTMGQTALDFSPLQNALGQVVKSRQFDAKLAQDEREFEARNKLAQSQLGISQAQLGIAQQAAARENEMAPLKLQMLKSQIQQAASQGAHEAQLRPLKLAAAELELRLTRAKAEGKDTESMFLRDIMGMPSQGGAPPAPQNPVQPQSYAPQSQPGATFQPMAAPQQPDADPMLVRTAEGPQPEMPQPAPTPQPPSVQDLIRGATPAQRAQFGLGMIGKGDAAKALGEIAGAQKLGKEAQNENDKAEVNAVGALARIDAITKRFDPKFLTGWEQAKQYGTSWKAWLGMPLPSDAAEQRQKFVAFQTYTVDNVNRHIKDMTGATVGVEEASRLMTAVPNMGMDPIQFKTSLDIVRQQSAAATARARYLRREGFMGKPWEAGLALEDMPRIIDGRGAQLEQQLQGQVPPDRIKATVRQQLKKEFGI